MWYIPTQKYLYTDTHFIVCIFTQPLNMSRIWHKVNFFKQSLTGFNSKFSFSKTGCHTKVKGPSLCYNFPIVGERIVGCIPFPRILVLCEIQTT